MDDLTIGEMIIASLSQIWHLIPIVIAIILFKKFMDNKNKKRLILKNEDNEKNGLTLQVRTIKKYEKLGYKVLEAIQNNKGIDLLCYKDEKTFIIHCNNTADIKSIINEDIKKFYTNSKDYLKDNNINEKGVEFRYVIAYSDALHKSANEIFMDDFYNCKYVVV